MVRQGKSQADDDLRDVTKQFIQDLQDTRYPRSPFFRLVRLVVRFWWFLLIYYASNVLPDVLKLIANQGLNVLDNRSDLLHALALDQVAALVRGNPDGLTQVIIGLLIVLVILSYMGHLANEDHKRESRVVSRRDLANIIHAMRDEPSSS